MPDSLSSMGRPLGRCSIFVPRSDVPVVHPGLLKPANLD